MKKGKVLIVDDEFHQRKVLKDAVSAFGYEVAETGDPEEAIRLNRFGNFDIVVTDLSMPKMTGIELLSKLRAHDPGLSVVMVTAHGTIETAVEAMKMGAEDYALKPIELPAFEILLSKIFEKRALVRENQSLHCENALLRKELKIQYHLGSILGKSDPAKKLMDQIHKSLKLRTPLLILGEKGTGVDDIARTIHYNGPSANNSLIFLDLTSIPSALIDVQLFGEEVKIGTNQTISEYPGLLEKAHLGTLVLSGLGHLPESSQVKLMRAIRDHKSQRVGGTRFFESNCRLIVASEPDVYEQECNQKKIQPEMIQLLKEKKIVVPPLRERMSDLPILIFAAVRLFESYYNRKIETVDPEVFQFLMKKDYPRNVTELHEIVKEALSKSTQSTLGLIDFLNS